MCKPRQSPRRRRSRPAHSETPRNRPAEIQAEIREVQERIEDSRRARQSIRNAAELTILEQVIARLTDRLAELLIAKALQPAADDQQTDRQARSRFQGAGAPLKVLFIADGRGGSGTGSSRWCGGWGSSPSGCDAPRLGDLSRAS